MSAEIITLIEKFLSNTQSTEEMHRLLQAYRQKQISQKQLDEYYAGKWNDAGQDSSPLADTSKERTWKQVQMHIRQSNPTPVKQKRRWITIAGGAAVAILFFVLGLSLQLLCDQPKQELIVKVENGQKATVQLPDGSHVHLNSASELRYAPDFGRKNRTVKLLGEAYFDVQSNPNNPFIVLTHRGLQIKATGTKFNVKSYPNEEQITGTLIEGRVEVSGPQLSEVLHPYEQITYHTKEMTSCKSYISNVEEAIFWMTSRFVFEQETLGHIAGILERTYNVTISFASPDLQKIQYSGKITNNSMENVLNLITVVSPLQYNMTGSHIVFSQKQIY